MYYMRVEVEQVRFKNGFKLYKSWLDGCCFMTHQHNFGHLQEMIHFHQQPVPQSGGCSPYDWTAHLAYHVYKSSYKTSVI